MSILVFLSVFFLYMGVIWIVSQRKEEKIALVSGQQDIKISMDLMTLSVYFKSLFGFLFPKNLQYQSIKKELMYSKWHKHSVEEYFAVRVLCLLFPLAIGFGLYFLNHIVGLIIGCLLFVLGFFLPQLILRSNIQKRSESQEAEILSFTEVLYSAAGGGLRQFEALEVAKDASGGVLSELINDAFDEVEIGNMSRPDALRSIKERTKVAEVKFLLEDLALSIENGTASRKSIEDILDRMYTMKDEHNSRRAQKLETKLTMVIMGVILPGLFIVGIVLPGIGYMNM